MKHITKVQDLILTTIGYGLAIWLLAGLFGFWTLLPQNTLWLVVKTISVALLIFVLIIRSEEAEDKTFREQIALIGENVLGFIVLVVIGFILLSIVESGSPPECNYPWSPGCP